jgi:predicted phosphodiesterase
VALAVLYDIHGNLPALDAVLADARAAGAQEYLLGGDYALFGPWPAETVARLRELTPATWIRGNVDRWTADPADLDDTTMEAVTACRSQLHATTVAELGALPEQTVRDGTRFCHASPLSDMRSFLPDPGEDDDELIAGAPERRIVFGHTHLAFSRTRSDGLELINPGSVGMPLDGDPRAAYALVAADGTLEHRRIAYDHEASAAAVRERFGDAAWATRSERRLLSAQP